MSLGQDVITNKNQGESLQVLSAKRQFTLIKLPKTSFAEQINTFSRNLDKKQKYDVPKCAYKSK